MRHTTVVLLAFITRLSITGSFGTSPSAGLRFTTGSSVTTTLGRGGDLVCPSPPRCLPHMISFDANKCPIYSDTGDHNRPHNNINGCPQLTISPTLKTECHIDSFGCFLCDASVVTITPTTNPVHTTTDITTTTTTLTQTAFSITSISTSPTTANKTTTHTTTLTTTQTTTAPTTATTPTVVTNTVCPPFESDCPDTRSCIDADANLCSVCQCEGVASYGEKHVWILETHEYHQNDLSCSSESTQSRLPSRLCSFYGN